MLLGVGLIDRAASWALIRARNGVSLVSHWAGTLGWQIIRGPSEGWMTFLLLLLSVFLAVWVSGGGRWASTLQLYGMVLCSSIVGLLLAKRRLSGWLLVGGGLMIGVVFTVSRVMALADGATRLDRLAEVGTRVLVWVQACVSGGTSTDRLPFGLFILFAAWLVGFLSSWFLFRRHSMWGALLPGGFVVVASILSFPFAAQAVRMSLYLLVAFLCAAHLFSVESEHDWERRGIQHLSCRSRLRLAHALWSAVAAVLVTSLLPIRSDRVEPVAAVWDRITSPMISVGEEFGRVLAGVPAEQPYAGHFFKPTEVFGGGAVLRETPVLIVEAGQPIYLAARRYDVYAHQGWETGDTQQVSPGWAPDQPLEVPVRDLQRIDVRVTSLLPLRAGEPVYVGGYPADMSIYHKLEVLKPARYRISIGQGGLAVLEQNRRLPLDLAQAVAQLSELQSPSEESLSEAQVRSMLPEDMRLVSFVYDTEGVAHFIVERRLPAQHDMVSVLTTYRIAEGSPYRMTVNVSTATERDLRAAGTEYPGWVLDRYLQLPDVMSSRVMELAQELTRDSISPYDKVAAVRDYVHTLDYTLEIEAPTNGACGVDYFLFELERGYCLYFASAMAVMLRASGVPSRLVVGYGPGEMVDVDLPEGVVEYDHVDRQSGQKVFMVANRHAWCEVFFPTYGWIAFEATPGHAARAGRDTVTRPHQDTDDSVYDPSDMLEEIVSAPGMPGRAGVPPGGGVSPLPDGRRRASTAVYAWPLAIIGVLAVLGLVVRLWRDRMPGPVSDPRAAYAWMWYLAALSRLAPQGNCTPYEWSHALTVAVPDVSADISRIVGTYVRACYGPRGITGADRLGLLEVWPRVRNALLRRALRRLLPRRR